MQSSKQNKKEMDGSCDEMTNGEGERGKYRDVRV